MTVYPWKTGRVTVYETDTLSKKKEVIPYDMCKACLLYTSRRYDLAKVGRYKFNKKLLLRNRITGKVLGEDVVDLETGEILAEAGTEIDRNLADQIQNAGVPFVWIQTEERKDVYKRQVLKEGASKAEADELKTKLEAEGAKVTLK